MILRPRSGEMERPNQMQRPKDEQEKALMTKKKEKEEKITIRIFTICTFPSLN